MIVDTDVRLYPSNSVHFGGRTTTGLYEQRYEEVYRKGFVKPYYGQPWKQGSIVTAGFRYVGSNPLGTVYNLYVVDITGPPVVRQMQGMSGVFSAGNGYSYYVAFPISQPCRLIMAKVIGSVIPVGEVFPLFTIPCVMSEPIEVSTEPLIEIRYRNSSDSYLGLNVPFLFNEKRCYIEGWLHRLQLPERSEVYVDSRGKKINLQASFYIQKRLETDFQPDYMHQLLQTALLHESVQVSEGFQLYNIVKDGDYDIEAEEGYFLSRAEVKVRYQDSFLERSS